jgi:hypothetical protein
MFLKLMTIRPVPHPLESRARHIPPSLCRGLPQVSQMAAWKLWWRSLANRIGNTEVVCMKRLHHQRNISIKPSNGARAVCTVVRISLMENIRHGGCPILPGWCLHLQNLKCEHDVHNYYAKQSVDNARQSASLQTTLRRPILS